MINRTPGGYEAWIALKAGTAAIGAFVSARARKASTFAIAVAPDGSRVTPGSGAASPIALDIHFVAQQALCNALGASGLHWVWAIAASSGSRLLFFRAHRAVSCPSRERPPKQADCSLPPGIFRGSLLSARDVAFVVVDWGASFRVEIFLAVGHRVIEAALPYDFVRRLFLLELLQRRWAVDKRANWPTISLIDLTQFPGRRERQRGIFFVRPCHRSTISEFYLFKRHSAVVGKELPASNPVRIGRAVVDTNLHRRSSATYRGG